MSLAQRARYALLGLAFILLFSIAVPGATRAEPTVHTGWSKEPTEAERRLLQQSLSVTELNKEIERIAAKESAAAGERRQTEDALRKQAAAFDQKREQAGRVLRAYYMGERDMLLQALLSARDEHAIWLLFDYYQFLFKTDQEVLETYSEQLKNLNRLRDTLARTERELSQVKEQLIRQLDRVNALQRELDTNLANSSDPEAMSRLIQEFTSYWQNIGMYEVRRHFRALADAMQKLPEFVKKSGNLQINGTKYTIMIQEEELNEFLREQDPIFEQFSFRFQEGSVSAEGESAGLSVFVQGHYTLESEPENRFLFHVDRLMFNGLELPDTTRSQLEEEFDLGFYPQRLVSFIEASDVIVEDKQITVHLSMKW
ncbi:hypothetical protein ABEX25_02605 [Paenibacillus thiaminolyticus]|uniref:hypothetical protein n=1 Tax=Paenibacillus thiaminolyticus TaxID=49283 RepID=UPI003D280731